MFEPSVFLAAFPYLFIAAFPLLGIAIVTKWVYNDRKSERVSARRGRSLTTPSS